MLLRLIKVRKIVAGYKKNAVIAGSIDDECLVIYFSDGERGFYYTGIMIMGKLDLNNYHNV